MDFDFFFGILVFDPKNYSKSLGESILTCFLEFKFLTKSDDFAKGIGFA